MENDDIKTKSNWLNSFCPVAEFYGIQVCPTDAQKATDSTETFHKMQIFASKSYATKTERTIQKKRKRQRCWKKRNESKLSLLFMYAIDFKIQFWVKFKVKHRMKWSWTKVTVQSKHKSNEWQSRQSIRFTDFVEYKFGWSTFVKIHSLAWPGLPCPYVCICVIIYAAVNPIEFIAPPN